MHDPWGGERPIDGDLLALLFEDQEQYSFPFPEPPFSHNNHMISPSDRQPHMGRVKYTARKKKKTSNSSSNQPATNTEGPSNDPQPINFSPPDIQPKARPRDGPRAETNWYVAPPSVILTRMMAKYSKKYVLPGITLHKPTLNQ